MTKSLTCQNFKGIAETYPLLTWREPRHQLREWIPRTTGAHGHCLLTRLHWQFFAALLCVSFTSRVVCDVKRSKGYRTSHPRISETKFVLWPTRQSQISLFCDRIVWHVKSWRNIWALCSLNQHIYTVCKVCCISHSTLFITPILLHKATKSITKLGMDHNHVPWTMDHGYGPYPNGGIRGG